MKPRFNSLDEWLEWQESLHWAEIDLGNERLKQVALQLDLLDLPCHIITVGGTNGKGSSVAMLDAILRADGYKTGSYTSPYLYCYNERIQVSGQHADDQTICTAFQAIDEARGDTTLTYFEFATLAAVWIFNHRHVDVAILEVGMGGRLDAVNLWDADVALISSIGIDHVAWLGNNREDIGREKAGIMRTGKPAIVGDLDIPQSMLQHAEQVGATLYRAGKEFTWSRREKATDWDLSIQGKVFNKLPLPALKGQFQLNNAATVITALQSCQNDFPVSDEAIRTGLTSVKLAGRLERVGEQPEVILDVAHNAHAAKELAVWLEENPVSGRTYALFSMLGDKDVEDVVSVMRLCVDHWYVSTVNDSRATAPDVLAERMISAYSEIELATFNTLEQAWKVLKKQLNRSDRVVVFGSFLVLSEFKVIF